LSAFRSERLSFASSDGTFGIPVSEVPSLLQLLLSSSEELDFLGFSYHLNSDSIELRTVALESALGLTFEARHIGLHPRIINIGGGFLITYADNRNEWDRFELSLKQSLVSSNNLFTWNRSGLGFYPESGRIKGAPRFMNHAPMLTGADQLCSLLKQSLPGFGGISAGQLLSESTLELWIEPGRALLDQVGITLARVMVSRRSEKGEPLLVLQMNRSNLNALELTLLTDPILIPNCERPQVTDSGYFLSGNLCVANELISPRKVYFRQEPRPGDLIAFINTAPYMMDFAESLTLHQPVARKIAIRRHKERFCWYLDDEYLPQVAQGDVP
jgi:diaminopimelate decarboxylase